VAERFLKQNDRHLFGAWLGMAVDCEHLTGDADAARAHVEVSIEEAKAADCASCEALAMTSLALLQESPAQRLATARVGLRLAYDIGETWAVLRALEVAVGALADSGALDDAALLSGALHALRDATGIVPNLPGRAAAHLHGEALARAGLDPDAFAGLVNDGRRLDYASAVAHALG
jgi:hypothetical protein